MKVLFVTGSFPPDRCGVGDYCFNLAKALSSVPSIQVAVLTSTSAGQIVRSEGVDVFPVIERWWVSEVWKFIEVIRIWAPTIVHIQYPTQGYGGGRLPVLIPLISFLMGKKVIQTWHEPYRREEAIRLFSQAIVPGKVIVTRLQYKENLISSIRWILWGKKLVWLPITSNIPKAISSEREGHVCQAWKDRYLNGQKRLIVFFGFIYSHKRVELLFEIADPDRDQIVIAGGMDQNDPYCRKILHLTSTIRWQGKAVVTGFLPSNEIAELLSAADAVVLPFQKGGGESNGTLHAAVLQGTFVLTTSRYRRGYDPEQNAYYANPDDIQEMKASLDAYAGKRRPFSKEIDGNRWGEIAMQHYSFYGTR